MIVAGIGCRRDATTADVAAVVRMAASTAGLTVGTMAAPWFKQAEKGLHGAATLLGLPLVFVDEAGMHAAQPHCPTRSAAVLNATGLASIAEAAALAASGGRLLLPRIALGGATCALAGP